MGAVNRTLMAGVGLAALLRLIGPAIAADLPLAMPVKPLPISTAYDWTGFYLGGHLGDAWGNSNWTASTTAAPTPTAVPGRIDAQSLR
jgi:opacity protein-like surface antigen